jgi:hypothetical protein
MGRWHEYYANPIPIDEDLSPRWATDKALERSRQQKLIEHAAGFGAAHPKLRPGIIAGTIGSSMRAVGIYSDKRWPRR